ncbi:sensor histidine kinase [Subtercola lobariae]|uniref:histidine kinase n=1 Tax=Subtercola lobariae TaxID=1588641 RepID=A0A917B7C0_9MICO|nr:histidine kinase [Subtercola lobariae]GGF29528.1 hypothetical protein GCM10011399_23370 [Subtercola lobariae]
MTKSRRPVAPPEAVGAAGRRAVPGAVPAVSAEVRAGAPARMPAGVPAGVLTPDATADALRLPRPPGVFRIFFARHPWFVDGVLVGLFVLPAALYVTLQAFRLTPTDPPLVWSLVAIAGAALMAVGILFRRAHPYLLVGAVVLGFILVFPVYGSLMIVPAVVATYAVAVYASVRSAWVSFGVLAVALGVASVIVAHGRLADAVGMSLSLGFLMLIATLIGVNVGNRKRYVEALLDRAAQLARERDQQALLATISERARIAREMHDIVAHSLTVMVALADGADATAGRDADRARAAMRQVAETGRTALADMRVVLGVLAEPVELGEAGELGDGEVGARSGEGEGGAGAAQADASRALLAPQPGNDALRPLIESFRGAGMVVHFTVSGAPVTDTGVQVMIFRVLQEALTNSLRYAPNPKHVAVTLGFTQKEIRLSVNDVGQAQERIPSVGSGRGVIGMRERVAAFGGTLEAGPTTAGGWQVLARVPLSARGES